MPEIPCVARVTAWFLLLTGWALAQPSTTDARISSLMHEPPRSLSFKVSPADAQLFYANQQAVERGNDGAFILERPRSDVGAAERLECEFRSPGFASVHLSLNWTDILGWSQSGGKYPEPIRLQPQSPRAYLHEYPWLLAPVAALPLAALWIGLTWKKNRRLLKRQERLNQLVPPEARQRDPLLGLSVGHYRLIRKLGEGGIASVYAAYPADSLAAEEAVAIKLLRLDLQNELLRRQFEKEIALTIQLDHPNIVRVIDWGWQETRAYLVMELLEGAPLSKRIPSQGLALSEVSRLLKFWAAALQYAHQRGILHRDVKPDNAFVLQSGLLKVLDFGLAGDPAEGMGTPGYMAPEQAAGKTVDRTADQYALGASLFQMLCGHRPFQAEDPFQELLSQATQDPPSLRQFRPDLPEAIERTVLRMLARNPAERFASLEEACLAFNSGC